MARFACTTRVGVAADALVTAMSTPKEQEVAALHTGAVAARAEIIEANDDRLAIDLHTDSPARRGGGVERATIHMVWDQAARTCHWRREDHTHGDRVRTTGEIRIRPKGEEACEFEESGEIAVNVPLIGKKIASKIAAAIERKSPERCRYWEERLTGS